MGFFRSMDFTRQQYFRVGSPPHSASNSRDLAMDTPAAEPSSYSTFDTLCGLVFGLAVLVLAVGACLLLGALVTYANAEQITYTDFGSPKNHKLESQALAASLVSYGVTCFTSGIPLLIFSYGGWIFLDLARNNRLQVQKTDDLARNNRLQVQKTDEVLKHLAEINPKYEERLRRGLSQEGGFPGGSLWTIPLEMCSIVGELTPISIDGGSPMSTITQRIASAFVVLCGRYGDVTKMAHDREQSRQLLYREASQVANAVDGTAVQSRIDELQRQLAGQQAQIQDLQERLEHAIEITRDKQDEFASVAQAEGVSLSVARRLLQVVAGSVTTPSVPTLGRATEEAGQRAGQLLEVLDEVAQPKVKQATADEIFLGPNRS